jgi:hypothetical protein
MRSKQPSAHDKCGNYHFRQPTISPVIPAKAHWRQVKVLSDTGIMGGNQSLAGHSEGATRSGLMLEKKIFPNKLIETTATEESLFPRLDRSSGLTRS